MLLFSKLVFSYRLLQATFSHKQKQKGPKLTQAETYFDICYSNLFFFFLQFQTPNFMPHFGHSIDHEMQNSKNEN